MGRVLCIWDLFKVNYYNRDGGGNLKVIVKRHAEDRGLM